jgi:hypothetical protein
MLPPSPGLYSELVAVNVFAQEINCTKPEINVFIFHLIPTVPETFQIKVSYLSSGCVLIRVRRGFFEKTSNL